VKAIDSNLLIYASLANHPAVSACETYIAECSTWVTNIVNLVELHRALVAVYGVSEHDAGSKFAELSAALTAEDLTGTLAVSALGLRQSYQIDFNGAVLLECARRRGITILATDDSQLALACAAVGIQVENPITPAVRSQMADWENQNIPAEGLPRILLRVH
jgi:predicted nucleic acid-binding protein